MPLLSRNKIQVVKDISPVISCCPVCNLMARHNYDLESIQKERACSECTLNFKYLDIDAWDKGVRPSIEKARSKIIITTGEI